MCQRELQHIKILGFSSVAIVFMLNFLPKSYFLVNIGFSVVYTLSFLLIYNAMTIIVHFMESPAVYVCPVTQTEKKPVCSIRFQRKSEVK